MNTINKDSKQIKMTANQKKKKDSLTIITCTIQTTKKERRRDPY